ncbi:MAG: TIGR00730 family Rossman fold protein [Crocinitomicaceae bacterium]|nr:TIGR00730 family Rossman fold protein [Crocinitomicaceae bacterium]
MKSIVVFCASSKGTDATYQESAYNLGSRLAELNIELIYGGGKVGLMGAVADGALKKNGKVTGIIPNFMTPHEIAHHGVSELIVVDSMHERKLLMHEKSDAVITLPGGFGTFEELFEILTWVQLGLYQKPVAIINQNGYYDNLKSQINHMMDQGLLNKYHGSMLYFANSITDAFQYFENFEPVPGIFKLKKDQT